MADSIPDIVSSMRSDERRADHELIDPESFSSNPFVYYRRMLEKTKLYDHYEGAESKNFEAIVLLEVLVTSPEALVNFGYFDKDTEISKVRFFHVCIPELDPHLPVPNDLSNLQIIKAFFSNLSRIAYIKDPKEPIEPGFIVQVKSPILSDKDKKISQIEKVVSKTKLKQQATSKPNDAFKKCIQELKLGTPQSAVSPSKPISGFKNNPDNTIFSSLNFAPEIRPLFSPALRFGTNSNTSQTTISQDKKNELTKKLSIKPEVVEACVDKNIQPPTVSSTSGSKDKGDPKNFVKDSDNTNKKTEIKLVDGTKFFSSLSEDPNSLILKGSSDFTSNNPVILREDEDRDVKMILIKNVQFLSASSYHQIIQTDKIPAAHFCVDNLGDIYQFTDTKNYIKNFNPVIDEKTIYIAVTNISFRNSSKTINFKNNINLQSGIDINYLDLQSSMLFDRLKLQSYLERKTGTNRQSINPTELILQDENIRENIFPNYRLDIGLTQRLSLRALIVAIAKAYNIKLNVPQFKGFDPNVAVGDFSGIIAPFNVSLSENEPYNLYELLGWKFNSKKKIWERPESGFFSKEEPE